jgi:hypothetical protein
MKRLLAAAFLLALPLIARAATLTPGSQIGRFWTATNLNGEAGLHISGSSGNITGSGLLIIGGVSTFKSTVLTRGTMSGWHLFAGTMSGAGLADCQGTSNKVTYDGTALRFKCETDQTGGGGTGNFGSGNVLTIGNGNWVKKAGDTMTGGLMIVSGGHTLTPPDAGLLLELAGVMSGRTLHAQDSLQSSGTLVIAGLSRFRSTVNVMGTMSGKSLYVGGSGSGLAPLVTTFQPYGTILMGSGSLAAGGSGSLAAQLYVSGRVTRSGSGSMNLVPTALAVQGRYAYVTGSGSSGANNGSLQVFDVSVPSTKLIARGSLTVGKNPRAVALQGRYALVANSGSSTLQVVDVSNAASPVSVSTLATAAGPSALAVQGRYAYVVDASALTLQVVDMADPRIPAVAGSATAGSGATAIAVQGRYAYVVGNAGVQVFDVVNPARPLLVGSAVAGASPTAIVVQGRYAYVLNGGGNTLQVFDVGSPALPSSVSTFATGTLPKSLTVQGRYAYVVNRTANTVQVIDVSNPSSPNVSSSLSTGNAPAAIVAQGRYAYAAFSNDRSLDAFDLGGAYSQALEAGSVEAASLSVRSALYAMDVNVLGGLTVGRGMHVQGASTIYNTATGSSPFALSILSTSGALRLSVSGNGASRLVPNIQFGSGITFDTTLWRDSANVLRTAGTFDAATLSGSALTVSGLPSCNFLQTSTNGSLQCISSPQRELILSAGGGTPQTGSGSVAKNVFFTVNQTNVQTQVFTSSGTTITTHAVQFTALMPTSYNGGVITAKFYMFTPNVSGNMKMFMQCRSLADGDNMDTTWGASGSVILSAKSTANQMIISAATGNITCGGTPAGGQPMLFRVYRTNHTKDAADTLAGSGYLDTVKVRYPVSTLTE